MENLDLQLYDIVEMKKPHPCSTHETKFQIVRLGADIKIMCLGCGNVIMLPREEFVKKVRRILSHEKEKKII